MSTPDPFRRLRRLVPFLAAAVILQAVLFAAAMWARPLPAAWPLLAGDIVFTGVVLVVLWRTLGRRR